MSYDSVCCMCGKAWSSRWLTTHGQHACVLLVIVNLFSLYLMNFMFYTTLDAVGNILRVHHKSIKSNVSFAQGSVSTLFRWGEHVIRVCVKCSSCLQQCKNYLKIKRVFPELWPQNCSATFFMNHSVCHSVFPLTGNYSCAHALRCGSLCSDPLYNPLGRSTSIYWSMYQTKTEDGRPTAKLLKQNKTATMTNASGEAYCGWGGLA